MVLSESVATIQRSRTACRSPLPWGAGGCHSTRGQGRILSNVTPSHWILSKIGTIASFWSTRECFRPSWTGGRMPPKTGCRLRAHTDLFNLIRAPNPTKSLRRDHADPRPSGSSRGGKSLAAIQLGLASTVFVPEDTPAGVSDPNPLSVADPPSRHPADVAQSSQGTAEAGDSESENVSSPVEVGSPESIYRSEWGVVNGSLLDTPVACQDLVDHVAPPGYFSELRHLHNDEFLRRYNVNLARQVAN
nr:hypothetical protein [Tanacetum cinerariifolium]